jgi:DNA-binding NarL/FixJ family response regulator
VRFYEDKILEYLPDSSASIRLARVDGNDEREMALISNTLRQQRYQCWTQILSGLIQSLQLELYEGDPGELFRDIPTENRDIDQVESYPSQDESLVMDLWAKGYTAKQIALRIGRTEKTILNRVALMRKTYGEQLVPRRRMA